MKLCLLAVSAAALFLTSGCSESVEGSENSISGWFYRKLNESSNKQIFVAKLNDKSNEYDLKFKLADGASFTFYAHAKDDLTEGIEFVFTRSSADLTAKVMKKEIMKVEGEEKPREVVAEEDVSAGIKGMLGAVDGEMNLKMEIHNDEDGSSHIIFESVTGEETYELFPADHHHHGGHGPHGHSPGKGAGSAIGFLVSEQAEFTAFRAEKVEGGHGHGH